MSEGSGSAADPRASGLLAAPPAAAPAAPRKLARSSRKLVVRATMSRVPCATTQSGSGCSGARESHSAGSSSKRSPESPALAAHSFALPALCSRWRPPQRRGAAAPRRRGPPRGPAAARAPCFSPCRWRSGAPRPRCWRCQQGSQWRSALRARASKGSSGNKSC